nr:uncharacterized protein LOC102084175 isoform X2 [Columba livia]
MFPWKLRPRKAGGQKARWFRHSLFLAFSKFGPLYSVRARRNAAVAGPGYYAIIKFYSAGDASRAQRACNGQRLFQKSPLKVCVCTKQKGFQQQVLALNSNKCQELANHYLGFNGWSSRIITLQNVSGFDGENEELGETLQKRSEEPTPIESKAEQGLNTNQRVFDNLLVNKNPHTASSRLEDAAEEEGSSVKGHLPAAPRTTETRQKQQNKGSSFPNNPGSSASPDDALVQGDLFEAKVNHHLRWLITEEALRAFITRMVRALGMDCSVPKLQPACAKLLDKLELLVKLLSERQDKQEASGLAGQCLREGNVSSGMGRAEYMGRKTSGKKAQYTSSDRLLLAIAVSVTIVINLLLMCLVEVYSSRHSAASHPQSAGKSRPKCFFQKLLPWGWGKNKEDVREQGSPVSDPSQTKPQWLRDLYLPLDPQQLKSIAELYDGDISDEEEMFNKFELNWMPTAPRKSCDPREMPLPADLIPRPSASSAHQELQIWSHFTAEDAPGGHAVRVPQNSPWRDGEPL